MDNEGLRLVATARVKLSKFDEHGKLISTEEHDVELTDKEAEAIWLSQKQA